MSSYGGPVGSARKTSTTVGIVVATVVCGLVFDGIVGAVVIPVLLSQRGTNASASARGGSGSDAADPNAGPDLNVGDPQLADDLALADVSTLGKEMATWYVDNTGAPSVQVSGGQYVVQGTPVGPVSQGITFGGVTGTGATDWCVWVSNPQGTMPEVSYSAVKGLQEGRC